MPAIRQAQEWGKRPTQVIMRDDWFGHRNPFTGAPSGDKDEWTRWDYALSSAYQLIEDNTDEYGLLIWEREDEAVDIDAIRRSHKFKAAVDNVTNGKKYKPIPGEYFIPDIRSRRRDENGREQFQSYTEWVEKENSRDSD